MHRYLILFLLSITFQTYGFGQIAKKEITPETKGEKKQEKRLYSFSQFGHETYLFIKQPITFKGKDWLRVGAVTASTIATMSLDKTIFTHIQGNQRYYYSVPVVAGRVYGEWYSIGGVAGAYGLYGLIARDTSAKKISIELLQAGIYSELVTTVFKVVIGRARPSTIDYGFKFHPFTFFNDGYHSMPSGHTTSAMALSTVMSRHAHSTALKILAYTPAAFTMFSRMYQNKHWLSDIVPAAAIGYFVGNWVVDLHEGKRHRINVTSIYPPGISISLDRPLTYK